MRFEVTCPALCETEYTDDYDHAIGLCLSMHEESNSYAYIKSMLGDNDGEYGEPKPV